MSNGIDEKTTGYSTAQHHDESANGPLSRVISIPVETFERLYLQPPEQRTTMALRSSVGNPSPAALFAFAVTTMLLSFQLMGWRSLESGQAFVGALWFCGGMIQTLCGIFEWVMGNTYTMTVLLIFGSFYMGLGALQTPSFGLAAVYAENTVDLYRGLGFYQIIWAIPLGLIALLGTRTNAALLLIFVFITITFCLAGSAYFELANGNVERHTHINTAAGVFAFVASLSGFYISFAQNAEAVGFPIKFPLGDLSGLWPDLRALKRAQEERAKARREGKEV